MKKASKFIALFLCAVMAVSAGSLSASAAFAAVSRSERVTVLVSLEDGVIPSEAAAQIAALTTGMKVKYIYKNLINGFAAEINAYDLGIIGLYKNIKTISNENIYSVPLTTMSDASIDSADETKKIYLGDDESGGVGTVVAVLDTGFDISHSVFKLRLPALVKIKKYDVLAARYKLNAGEAAYISPKLPFVYDYTKNETDVFTNDTHGTGTACIIAGQNEHYRGVAPEAQLLLMKVFGDNGLACESDVIAALEDAVLLGADIINLSLGSAVGADDGYPLDPALAEALYKAAVLGVTVNGAAGNEGHIGVQSDISSKLGIALPSVATMDYGTVNSPASIGSVNAVASKNSDSEYKYCVKFDDRLVPFTDTNAMYKIFGEKSFTQIFDGKTYNYVAVDGLGKAEDFEQVTDSLMGAIALIKRGELTFVEKVNNAAKFGAVAAVIWDNIEDNPDTINMDLSSALIPAIFIEHKYGAELSANKKGEIIIEDKLLGRFPAEDNGRISDTSSWGVTPGFVLKPEFTSTGVNVLTASVSGSYIKMSGTSAANAYASGEAALLYEALRGAGCETDTADITRRFMNSAEILTDAESGLYYSPRRQGAGAIIAAAAAAIETKLVNKSTGQAKIERSSISGTSVTLELILENNSDISKTYVISCAVQGDAYETYTTEDESFSAAVDLCRPRAFDMASATLYGSEINFYSDLFEGAEISVGAGESADISIEISLDNETALEYGNIFSNGFYLEGFITANPTDGSESASVPYVCFTGDWGEMKVFDATVYEMEESSYYNSSYFYTASEDFLSLLILGGNWFTVDQVYDKSLVAFSPNNDGEADRLYLSLAMLRSARQISGFITDINGSVIADMGTIPYLSKSLVSDETFYLLDFMVWDGSDNNNPYFIYPDGVYTLTINAYPAYEDSNLQTFCFDFVLDTAAPVIKSMRLTKDADGMETLEITVSDETALQGALLYPNIEGFLAGAYGVAYSDGHKTEDIYRYNIDGWRDTEIKHVYIDIYDYALNRLTVKVPLAELAGGKR